MELSVGRDLSELVAGLIGDWWSIVNSCTCWLVLEVVIGNGKGRIMPAIDKVGPFPLNSIRLVQHALLRQNTALRRVLIVI